MKNLLKARPVIQSPMAGIQGAALASEVSRAGGIGSLPCALWDEARIGREVDLFRSSAEGPLNLNFFCHEMPSAKTRMEEWLQTLAPEFERLGLRPEENDEPLRLPFTEKSLKVVLDVKPEIVSFHFGLPSPHLLNPIKAAGIKILSTATTRDEALWLRERNVDAIILQGLEAGGHRGHFLRQDLEGQKPLKELLLECREVDLPLIAAGGIATAVDVRDLLKFRISGIQIGTALLLSKECETSEAHRRALKDGSATVITNVMTGRAARGLWNKVMKEYGPLSEDVPPFPLASRALGRLKSASEARGLSDFSTLWAGEKFALAREGTAQDTVREFVLAFKDN